MKHGFDNNGFCFWLRVLVLSLAVTQSAGAQELSARDLNLRGIQSQAQGKLAEAAEDYRKAIQLNPNGAAYHNNLALVLKDMDQLDLAEQEAKLALKLRPKRADYHCNLGIVLMREKKPQLAEQQFREACGLDAMDTESHYRLAQALKELDKLPEAEQEIKLALMLKPDNLGYHQLFGDILLEEKREEEALNEYHKASGGPDATISGELRSKIDYLQQVLKSRQHG
jgi:Tfp pilus assembly protein PilF